MLLFACRGEEEKRISAGIHRVSAYFSVSTTLCGSVMAGGWSIEALFSLEEATVSSVNNMS